MLLEGWQESDLAFRLQSSSREMPEVICRNHYGRYGNKHAGNFSGSSKTEIKHSELWQKYNYKTSRKKTELHL